MPVTEACYFTSAKFKQRLREIVRMTDEDFVFTDTSLEHVLGCPVSEFSAYVEAHADDTGTCHFDLGDIIVPVEVELVRRAAPDEAGKTMLETLCELKNGQHQVLNADGVPVFDSAVVNGMAVHRLHQGDAAPNRKARCADQRKLRDLGRFFKRSGTDELDELVKRRAMAAPSSWNEETREFEVTFATPDAAVNRWDMDGAYREMLAVDGFRLREGVVPLLDNHRRGSLADQLGVVSSARVVGREARAIVRLSRHHPQYSRLAGDLADGLKFGISVGYLVDKWKTETDRSTGVRTKTATSWTVHEISVVNIPADRSAITRSETMPETVRSTPASAPENPAPAPATTPTAAPGNAAVTTEQVRSQPVQTRAQINGEIRNLGRVTGAAAAAIDQLIDNEASLDEARRAFLDAMTQRSAQAPNVTHSLTMGRDFTDPQHRIRAAGEALYARANPGHQPSEQARPFMGLGTVDLARECLRHATVPIAGLSPAVLIERALHTTSDFPLILGDAMGRTLREGYEAAPSGLKQVARQTTARDFRDKHRLQLSAASGFEKVNEHGEFKSGSLAEAKESYRLSTYGQIIGITRQALINDDLGAFNDLARRIGQAASAHEATLLVDLLISGSGNGPAMSDGKALFHADHNNKAQTGAALDLTTLGAARLALRKQSGLKGEFITVAPKYLVVPADLETAAEKLLTQIAATKAEDVNVFASKLDLVVEPRFTSATRWYVAADPASIDGLEYAYLEGEPGVQIETGAGFRVDGVQVKARLDFGAGFVDHRSWYMNAGS